MIVLKENQRLYLHSCNYNMARMMSVLANLVKEHGGRVKPTRQALISDRNCKDAEPIRETRTTIGRCWPSLITWTPQRNISSPSVPTPSSNLFMALTVTESAFNHKPALGSRG